MPLLRAHPGRVEPARSGRCRRRRRPELYVLRLEDRTLLSSALGGVDSPPAVTLDTPGLNVAVTTDPGVQQMPSIAVDPLDSNHLAMAYMDRSLVTTGYAGIGVAVSRDNGVTWQRTSVPLPPGFDQGAGNPTLRFDDKGHVFVSYEAATFLGPQPPLTNPTTRDPVTDLRTRTFGFQANNGIFVARSDDGGLTWGAPAAVASNIYTTSEVPFEIFPELNIDTYRTRPSGQANPYYGDVYVNWSRYYSAGQFPGEPTASGGSLIMLSISHDLGRTWQLQLTTNPANGASISVIMWPGDSGIGVPPGLGRMNNSHLAIGPEGDLYVNTLFYGSVAVSFSTDGGKSFATPDEGTLERIAFDSSIWNSPLSDPPNSFRTLPQRAVAADPTRPGYVYVADMSSSFDAADGTKLVDPADVYFARSTDYGVTWQTTFKIGTIPAQVLNDDNGGQIATGQPGQVTSGQALVRLATAPNGDIVAIWYDTRRDPANHLLDVFGAVSHDGGLTFSPNFRITTASFDASAGMFIDPTGRADYYLGDTLGLAVAGGSAYAAWTDTRAGNQNVEFARVPIDPPPAPLTDRLDPNSSPATATDLGSVSVGTALSKLAISSGDQDWFRFQATATGVLILQATASQAGNAPSLELLDSSGSTVLASGLDQLDAQGRRTGERIDFAGVAGRTYLARVMPSGASGDVSYSLEVQSLTADLGTRVQADGGGAFAPGDQAYYLVRAGVSGSMEVTLAAGADLQGALQFEVKNPDTLAVLATGQGQGGTDKASVVVTQGQALLVHVFGTIAAQGHYLLDFVNLDQYETPDNSSLLFPAGAGPSEVALADLTGNGKVDAVVTNALSNTVSVLLGNGDGTFQAPRQFAVGSFIANDFGEPSGLSNFGRALAIADFNRDGIPDIVVTNLDSGDISVLLGRGDGTFEPQRRFDATSGPASIAVGDLNGDGIPDIAIPESIGGPDGPIAILLGRGDGTFQKQQVISSPGDLSYPSGAIGIADVNHDGHADLIVSRGSPREIQVLLGRGDGTFESAGAISGPLALTLTTADLNDDNNPDVIVADNGANAVRYALGRADGTFGPETSLFAGQAPTAVAVADMGSQITLPDGSTTLGPPDGIPDLIVTASGITLIASSGPPQVTILPGLRDKNGHFAGFGNYQVLAPSKTPQNIQIADLTGGGVADAVVVQQNGLQVIYGKRPTLPPNDTPQRARNLGTIVHVVEPALAIIAGHEDAYYQLTVPTESAHGAGDELIDFSGGFQHVEGAGLGMEVLDASGHLLGSGARFRIVAAEGAMLTIHVFGATAPDGTRCAGAYALDIDVLPQVVSVQAQSVLPGAPATSIVLTLQGDRLDPATAQDPANYTVLSYRPGDLSAVTGRQVIPLSASSLPVVYDASANLNVASGLTYPTAVRQTVTLLFDQPLSPGTYEIVLAPKIQAAVYNVDEAGLLAGDGSFAGHPVVSARNGAVVNGGDIVVTDLVTPAGTPADPQSIARGTPFLTQLQGDLGALLDNLLTQKGDDPTITASLNSQILARFAPTIPAAGGESSSPTSYLIVWFDPVSLDLQSSQGKGVSYSLATNALASNLSQTFVSVGGNVEVVVSANAAGTFNLDVGNVPGSARGGAVTLNFGSSQEFSFTAALREGTSSFQLSLSDSADAANGSSTGPADTPGAPSPGGGGGGSLAAGLSQQAGLALAIALIGSPTGEVGTAAAPGSGGSGSATAGGAPGGAGQSLSPNSGQSGSSASDGGVETQTAHALQNLLNTIDQALRDEGEKLGKRLPLVKSTLRILERATVVGEALGWRGRPIVSLLLRKMMEVLEHPGKPAAVGAGNPIFTPRLRRTPPRPVDVGWDEIVPWDAGLERLSEAENRCEVAIVDRPAPGIEACWAVFFLSTAALQARGGLPCLPSRPRRRRRS